MRERRSEYSFFTPSEERKPVRQTGVDETVRVAAFLAQSLTNMDVLPDSLHLIPIAFGINTVTVKGVGTQLQVPKDVPSSVLTHSSLCAFMNA